jgi:hypothetical protein
LSIPNKIKDILNNVSINNEVFNGTPKVVSHSLNFMNQESIRLFIKPIKPKNAKWFDRIPLRILTDGIHQLLDPLAILFNKIYYEKNP